MYDCDRAAYIFHNETLRLAEGAPPESGWKQIFSTQYL